MAKTLSLVPLQTQALGSSKKKQEEADAEKLDLIRKYQGAPTKDNLSAALHSYDDVIKKATTAFAGGYDNPITQRRARLLAVKALKSYDPKGGASPSSHIYNQLQQLRRLAPSISEPVIVPESVIVDRHTLDDGEAELFDMLGRDPSDSELADYTNLSLKRIAKIRKMNTPVNEGAFSDPENPDLVEAPGVQGKDQDDVIMDYVYHDLSPIDQKVFELRTGYGGRSKASTEEIAQILGRPYKWVSQRASIIQGKLNDALGVA